MRKSLRPYFEYEFYNHLVFGVEDVSVKAHSERLGLQKYINAGVLLLNNKKLKEGGYTNKMFNWLSNNLDKIECHDQDVINVVLKDGIEYAEDTYGAQVQYRSKNRFEKIEDPAILHFISPQKPWTVWKPLCYTNWEKEYFNAIKDTPFDKLLDDYRKKAKWVFPLRIFYPSGVIKDFIRQIFSIRNSDDRSHKIVSIMFFKIKYKKKKQIQK